VARHDLHTPKLAVAAAAARRTIHSMWRSAAAPWRRATLRGSSRCRSRRCSSACADWRTGGHVKRAPNPDDRRSYRLQLTPAGKRLLAWARPLCRARALAVEAPFSENRVTAFRDAHTELGKAIERELRDAAPESPTRTTR
jgi:hypothetical protein